MKKLLFLLLTSIWLFSCQTSQHQDNLPDLLSVDYYLMALEIESIVASGNEPDDYYLKDEPKERQLQEALLYLDTSLQIDPTGVFAYYLAHRIYLQLNNEQKAFDMLDSALYYRPNDPGIYIDKAKLHLKTNNEDRALPLLERASYLADSLLIEDPHSNQAIADQIMIQAVLGNFSSAYNIINRQKKHFHHHGGVPHWLEELEEEIQEMERKHRH